MEQEEGFYYLDNGWGNEKRSLESDLKEIEEEFDRIQDEYNKVSMRRRATLSSLIGRCYHFKSLVICDTYIKVIDVNDDGKLNVMQISVDKSDVYPKLNLPSIDFRVMDVQDITDSLQCTEVFPEKFNKTLGSITDKIEECKRVEKREYHPLPKFNEICGEFYDQ